MSRRSGDNKVVWKVTAADPRLRLEVEQYLRAAGYPVLGGDLPPDGELGTVTEEFEITRRELEVLQTMLEHDDTQKIADALGISKRTVEGHIQRLEEKLEAHNRHRLLVRALRLGLVRLRLLPCLRRDPPRFPADAYLTRRITHQKSRIFHVAALGKRHYNQGCRAVRARCAQTVETTVSIQFRHALQRLRLVKRKTLARTVESTLAGLSPGFVWK